MATQGLPQVFDPFLTFLRERVKERTEETQAREALEHLCEKGRVAGKGFDPNRMAFFLHMISLVQDSKVSGRLPTPLRYGDRKHECLRAKDLNKIAKQARELRVEIRKLRLTNFVFEALLAGQLPAQCLLAPQLTNQGADLNDVAELSKVADLPDLWRWYKAKSLHGTDGSLWRLCQYIEKTTGGPHDSLLIDILGPLKIAHCHSPDALKVWRGRVMNKAAKKRRDTASSELNGLT